jgi:Cu(I)/Ag(I) efflux system membrane fusion protein
MMNPNASLKERPAGSAPDALSGQWSPVPRALHRLLREPSEASLENLSGLIRGIDGSKLQPDESELWKEFSRRLLNSIETAGQLVGTNPQSAAEAVSRAIEDAGLHLGLPYQPEAPPSTDPAFAKVLKEVISKYLPLGAALAKDDAEAATKAATALADFLKEQDFPEAAELSADAMAVADAADIKAKRIPFEKVSKTLIAITREQGIDAVGNAYVVHCPMAFSGKGADWIAAKPIIENPYFGDAMFDCGTVTDTLSVEK